MLRLEPIFWKEREVAEEDINFGGWTINPYGRAYHQPGYTPDWPWPKREHARGYAAWSPPMELAERGDELVVRIDLPGVGADDVTVEISAGGLTVKGERKSASPPDHVLMSEQPSGKFYRVIPVPGKIEEDRVSAKFQNGILEITLPAPRTETQVRQIYVAMHPGIHTTDPPPPLKPPPDKKTK